MGAGMKILNSVIRDIERSAKAAERENASKRGLKGVRSTFDSCLQ